MSTWTRLSDFDRKVLAQLGWRALEFSISIAALATLFLVLYAIGAHVYVGGYEAGYGVGVQRYPTVTFETRVIRGLNGQPAWVLVEACQDTARVIRARGDLP